MNLEQKIETASQVIYGIATYSEKPEQDIALYLRGMIAELLGGYRDFKNGIRDVRDAAYYAKGE